MRSSVVLITSWFINDGGSWIFFLWFWLLHCITFVYPFKYAKNVISGPALWPAFNLASNELTSQSRSGTNFGHKRRKCSRIKPRFQKDFTLSGCVSKIEWHELFTGDWKQENISTSHPSASNTIQQINCWRPSFGALETLLSPKYNVWGKASYFQLHFICQPRNVINM